MLRTGRAATRSTEIAADPRRFESVYRSCQAELYRYVLSIVRDPHAAEDVLQSAVTRAMESLVHEERDFELRPWLFRIAHNEAISRFRRERLTTSLDDGTVASAALASTTTSVADTVETNEELDQLWKDLATLPDRQRQALVLRELSGLGHDEIGAVLGSSARAVKQTIFEARRALLEQSQGRAMECVDVQRTLSDGDGRMRRSRRMRAHLADCAACQAFDVALTARPERLAALAPALPLGVSASLLAHLFPGAKGAAIASASTTTAGVSGAVSGSAVSGLLAGKVAVLASVGALAAGATGATAVVRHHEGVPPTADETVPAAGTAGTGGAGGVVGGAASTAAAGDRNGSLPAPGTAASPQPSSAGATTPGRTGTDGSAAAAAAGAASKGRSEKPDGASGSAAARAKANGKSEAAKARGKGGGQPSNAGSSPKRGGAASGASTTRGTSGSSKGGSADSGQSKPPAGSKGAVSSNGNGASSGRDASALPNGAAADTARGSDSEPGASGGASSSGGQASSQATGRPEK